jgi:hypothetical protein
MKSSLYQSQLENILDCFTGADGGVSFMNLKILLEDMERQEAEGDEMASEVLKQFSNFSRLIDCAQKAVKWDK